MTVFQLELKNGGSIAYNLFGSSDPSVLLIHYHGFPSCRLEATVLDYKARERGIAILAIDRPGFGQSPVDPEHSLEKFAKQDVVEVLEHALSENNFKKDLKYSVLGISGGGPYTEAAIYYWNADDKLPNFSTAVFCAGLPLNIKDEWFPQLPYSTRFMYFLMHSLPTFLSRWMYSMQSSQMSTMASSYLALEGEARVTKRNQILYTMSFQATKADLDAMSSSFTAIDSNGNPYQMLGFDYVMEFMNEANQQPNRVDAFLQTSGIYSKYSGFSLEDAGDTKVYVLQGGKDSNVPPVLGKNLSEQIRGARYCLYEEEGHLSILINKVNDILDAVLGSL